MGSERNTSTELLWRVMRTKHRTLTHCARSQDDTGRISSHDDERDSRAGSEGCGQLWTRERRMVWREVVCSCKSWLTRFSTFLAPPDLPSQLHSALSASAAFKASVAAATC